MRMSSIYAMKTIMRTLASRDRVRHVTSTLGRNTLKEISIHCSIRFVYFIGGRFFFV